MTYNNKKSKTNPFQVIKIKTARTLASGFPLNRIRIWGLRLCGFQVGKKVYLGSGLVLTMSNSASQGRLIIGDRVAIAPRVTLVLASDANWSRLSEIIPPVEGEIVLKDDCWLGTGSILLPNVTIGEMSVVGAGSVVTKDVPPYTIVAGVPAKEIRKLDQ